MMRRLRLDESRINAVYDRTDGRCHLCGNNLAFSNYGRRGARGAWHADHSRPLAYGGTNRLTNLFPACVSCNLAKGTRSTRTARRWYGRSRAPLSRQRAGEERLNNQLTGLVVGAGIGALIDGQRGAIWGAFLGLVAGDVLSIE